MKTNEDQQWSDNAQKIISEVKKSTLEIEAKNSVWRIVPGFKRYEFNGKILRNVETKRALSLKAKNNKYQLIGDNNKNCDRSQDQIIDLMPKATITGKKVAKPESTKKQKKVAVKKNPDDSKITIKSRVICLYKTGLTATEVYNKLISQGIIVKIESVRWYISINKTGHKRA